MNKATPRPWGVFLGGESEYLILSLDSPKQTIACTYLQDEERANAALIVRAVNMHDELVEQLRKAWLCIELIKEHAPDYEKKASEALLKDIGSLIAKAEGVMSE